MFHFPLRICKPFKSWYLCIRYCGALPGKEEYTFKTGIQGNARWCIRKYLKCDDRRTDYTVLIG